MFKLVFVFGVMVASAVGESTSRSKLSRHAELSKPSDQTNQPIAKSFVKPIIDNLKTQQQKLSNSQDPRTQTGTEPLIWLLKWSLTNHSCPPAEQMNVLCNNEDLAVSVSVSVRNENRNHNKFDKIVEAETTHPRERRDAPVSRNELNLLDDWIESKAKSSHISHIYIGESLYPYIYEESRVFKSEPPNPSSGENTRVKEVRQISETRAKKEEVPVYVITKIFEIK